jgi:hypothetical protein
MAYENSTSKTVLVLNTEFSAPALMNASGHTALGLLAAQDPARWNFLDYPSPSFGTHSKISEYPVVVLRSKRSAPLEKLVRELKNADIAHNVFIDSMLGQTADQQQQATRQASPGKERIVCVALFGDEVAIRPLIKSFSIYKA